MMNEFCNFKRYNQKGQRMALFGKIFKESPNHINLVAFRCSAKDQFNKDFVKKAYEKYRNGDEKIIVDGVELHPEAFVVEMDNPATPKKCFLEWCRKNYFVYGKYTYLAPFSIKDVKIVFSKPSSQRKLEVKYLTHGR